MTVKEVIESLNRHSAYYLAGVADTFTPDTLESSGAEFLTRVRDSVVESLLWELEKQGEGAELAALIESWRDGEAPFEIADDAPSVYNHERMKQLVDLGAYMDDVSEFGESKDIITAAGYALYQVARQLIDGLLSELEEYEEDDEAEA